jgi:hypothetical protein
MYDEWCNMAARIHRAMCSPRAGRERMRSSAARKSDATEDGGSLATVFETTPASPTDKHRSIKDRSSAASACAKSVASESALGGFFPVAESFANRSIRARRGVGGVPALDRRFFRFRA